MKTIYLFYCTECNKSNYSFIKYNICLNCNKQSGEQPKEMENPIEKVKPLSLVITKSIGELNPLTCTTSDILHIGISNSQKQIFHFWNSYKVDKPDSSLWKDVVN